MPEFILPLGSHEAAQRFKALSLLTQGYVEALFFTSTGPGDEDLALAPFDDLADDTLDEIIADCDAFELIADPILSQIDIEGYGSTEAGRDFWYSRSGAGTGFWARDELGDLGDQLDKIADAFRGRDLYRGDDGKLYLG
jgi:hypothetical protein